MGELDEGIVKEFLVESYENLDQLDRDLVSLEHDPTSRETLASVFRTIHTIKGTCGFLGFTRLEAVAHSGESLLSRLRDGQIRLVPEVTSVLLRMVDAVRRMLGSIERSRVEGDEDNSGLIEALKRATGEKPAPGPAPTAPSDAIPPAQAPTPPASPPAVPGASAAPPVPGAVVKASPAPRPGGDGQPEGLFESLIRAGRIERDQVEMAVRLQQMGDPRRVGEILVDMGVLQPDDVLQALKAQAERASASIAQSNIRVDVEVLERLMNRVGELVLARNQMLQLTATQDWTALPPASQRLSQITSELQEAVMKTRMQPIETLWSRLPRIVRDVAELCGKQVHVEVQGGETDLDKSVIEAIKDPLTHLVRNAVDHGIEVPAERVARGKPPEGCLRLRAYHDSGQVHIEVADDGAGIPVERIRARALERDIVAPEQASHMTDGEWLQMIFLPGFSTADSVTHVSGRGVGMDVVKANLERIGGTIEVQSRTGLGTTMKIRIPLTLAIIPALCVRAGGEDYAIPQASLVELVRLQGEAARGAIQRIQDAAVYRLRGNLLPLIDLNDWLGLERRPDAPARETLDIVVLQTDGRRFGLVVDSIGDSREIIVKPLGRPLSHLVSYAGATILGDGHVALILDVRGIAREAGITASAARPSIVPAAPEEARDAGAPGRDGFLRQSLLVFELREGWRAAVPLRQVLRLEEFAAHVVEQVGDRQVVQYRGEILPLVRLERLLVPGAPSGGPLPPSVPVLVCTRGGRSVGLVVERILDIEDHDAVAFDSSAGASSVIASLVIADRVTDVLDLEGLLGRAGDSLLAAPLAESAGAGS